MILLASIGFWLFFMVLAQAMDYNIISQEDEPEAYCLAQNILFESSTEPLAGKIAVALVVLNRVNDSRYPNTVCAVIKEGPVYESWKTRKDPNLKPEERIYFPVRHRCQFSKFFLCGKSKFLFN